MDSALSGQQAHRYNLTGARQIVELLKSQLQAGTIDRGYWLDRLEELGRTLAALAEQQSAEDDQRRLIALYRIIQAIGSTLDLEEVLNQVMDAIIQLTGAERGFLMLFDSQGELEVKVARNMAKETLNQEEFAISRSVIRTVAQSGQPVVTTNAAEDPRFATQASVVAHGLRSIQCVPLRARGKIIGVVYVDNRVRSGAFSQSDLETLSSFATQAAIAIENARLFTMTDKALAARVEELSMMQEIDKQLNETLDFAKVMDLTLEWAVRVTKADNGAIGLIDLEKGQTVIVAQHGKAPASAVSLLADGVQSAGSGSLTVPIQREGRVIGVIVLSREGGQPFDQEAHAFLLRLADHAAIAIENARLYDAVKQANQAKTEFVSVMTHELRLPMTSIKGYAEMLEMAGNLSDKQKRYVSVIRNSVQRMSVLISDLSDISRIESGRLDIQIQDSVDLRLLVGEALIPMQTELERRGHTLEIDIPDDIPAVRIDPGRTQQVLTNLISNACKYTPDRGAIAIRAKKQGDHVLCEVQDTGMGMTPEELQKVFTKFWRSEDTYVRDQPGSGLGLAIAKSLVELQGGKMSVVSEKGVGTTFSFTMPVSA